MNSISSSQASPPPSSATRRTDRLSHSAAAAATAKQVGFALLPWQRLVLDTALEHENGRLAYRTVTVSVPRQSGKTLLMLTVLLHRMLSAPDQRLVYAAQNRLSARSRLLDTWWPKISRSPLASKFKVTRGMGGESLRASNGSLLTLLSTDEAAGHGDVLDLVVLDECWSLDQRAEQATRPAMVTRRNAQTWMVSTAGNTKSVWWRQKIDAARQAAADGVTTGSAFFEWAAVPGDDINDPATWRRCMPGLGFLAEEATIAADIKSMSLAEARRAYLNLWPDEIGEGWQVIPQSVWEQAQV
jgi:phage terminase large subunit-like protein